MKNLDNGTLKNLRPSPSICLLKRLRMQKLLNLRLLLPLLALPLLTACQKDEPAPPSAPKHIRVSIDNVGHYPVENNPSKCSFGVKMKFDIDSLATGEKLLGIGILWLPAGSGEPCYSPTTPGRDYPLAEGALNPPVKEFSFRFQMPFLPPGKEYRFRTYIRTNKTVYYSEGVTWGVPAIAPPPGECTELPVVFHLLTQTPGQISRFFRESLAAQLTQANLALRNAISVTGQGGEDTRIRLVPATHDPQGKRLTEPGLDIVQWAQPGMDPDSFLCAPTAEQLALCWDPYRYLNIWIFPCVSDLDLYGIALLATMPTAHPLEGMEIDDYYSYYPRDINPGLVLNADYIHEGPAVTTLGHELGHVLGLLHAFSYEVCGDTDDYCDDTPDYLFREWQFLYRDDFAIPGTACDGSQFTLQSIMDYNGYQMLYTPDQNARIQQVLQYAYFIPGSEAGRQRATTKAPAGLVRPTPRTVVLPVSHDVASPLQASRP